MSVHEPTEIDVATPPAEVDDVMGGGEVASTPAPQPEGEPEPASGGSGSNASAGETRSAFGPGF